MSSAAPSYTNHTPHMPRVLVVDDQPQACEMFSLIAGKKYQCLEAFSGDAALKVLEDNDVDVIVSDVRMPGMNGIELLERALVMRPNAARILISGYSDADAIILGINKGHILFFINKPFEKSALHAVLQQAAEYSHLMHERTRLIEELTSINRELEQRVQMRTNELQERTRQLEDALETISKLANNDPLTGLANRRCMDEVLKKELLRSKRSGTQVGIILADLDHFKQVNDTYGHSVGDAVLVAVADVLRKMIRPYDLAVRYGGEELVIVMPDATMASVSNAAERLRTALHQIVIPDGPGNITASFGVSVLSQVDSIDEALTRVDGALYEAKVNGRDRVVAAKLNGGESDQRK